MSAICHQVDGFVHVRWRRSVRKVEVVTDLEEQLNAERRRVDVDTNNFPVRELVRMLRDGELNIAPAYQRKFRWPAETESALIESVFLGLPIPSIFVATNEGFEWEVVDGLQRLSTLAHFMAESEEDLKRIRREEPLRLTGLTKVSGLDGLLYTDLPKPLQIYFGRQPLQITALTDKSDLRVRFDLFERLNRGAIALSEQEVRACLYGGELNDLIERLSADETYASLLKLQPAKQSDGTAAELVLGLALPIVGEHLDGAGVEQDHVTGFGLGELLDHHAVVDHGHLAGHDRGGGVEVDVVAPKAEHDCGRHR